MTPSSDSSIPISRPAPTRGGIFSENIETQIERELSNFIENIKSMSEGQLRARMTHTLLRSWDAYEKDKRDHTDILYHEWAGMSVLYDELQRRIREAKP